MVLGFVLYTSFSFLENESDPCLACCCRRSARRITVHSGNFPRAATKQKRPLRSLGEYSREQNKKNGRGQQSIRKPKRGITSQLVDVTQEQQRSVPILYSRGQRVPKRTAVGPSVAHSEKLEPPQLTTDVSHGI